jgi:hypothetical protein
MGGRKEAPGGIDYHSYPHRRDLGMEERGEKMQIPWTGGRAAQSFASKCFAGDAPMRS